MKILHSWLRDFIDIDAAPGELAGTLTSIGMEVEEMERIGAQFTGVSVAQVLEVRPHPNADKLHLVDVETGSGRKTVVCGAPNVAAGQKVALAVAGSKLPGGVLKKSKIRGVESEGMLCAGDELGLPGGTHDGILVLDPALAVGRDVSTLFGEPDCVYDLKAPNRPDLLSHYGVARELSVYFGLPLKKPETKLPAPSGKCLPVAIDAPELCGRYLGRVLRNVSARPSPEWMQRRLKAVGSTPRNILVDATNYVLHELGYPLHAFDLSKITGGQIRVRRAADGEKFTALDNRAFELDGQNLLITDGARPLALAGVIGGLESGIYDTTGEVFLEAAWFEPPNINKTSHRFGIRTDAAVRFEGGVDIEAAEFASARAASLIAQVCGGMSVSETADAFPRPYAAKTISFTPERLNTILGTAIATQDMARVLGRIQPALDASGPVWKFATLSHRYDLSLPCDLAEEVARMCGFDKIGDAPRPVTVCVGEAAAQQRLADKWRDLLCGLGFYEAWNYDFMSLPELELYGFGADGSAALANPLASDWKYLRRTLLCGLVKTLVYNESRGASAPFFEVGKAYRAVANGGVEETLLCSGLLCGKYPAELFWRAGDMQEADFHHIKGVAARLISGLAGARFMPAKKVPSYLHPKLALEIFAGERPAGFVGKLHPAVAKAAGLRNGDAFAFEISADAMSRGMRPARFNVKPASPFPSSWRDLSVLLPEQAQAQLVLEAARKAAGQNLSRAEMTDLYQGKGMPEGKKSVTMRLTFTPHDKTLTDAEVDAAFKGVLDALTARFGAVLRS